MQHYTRDTIQRLLNKKYGDINNLTSSTVVIHILTHGINDDSIGFECNEGYGQKSEVQLENTGYTVNVIILRFTDHRVFSVCSKKKNQTRFFQTASSYQYIFFENCLKTQYQCF